MKKIQQLRKSWEILFGMYATFTVISTALLLVALVFNDLPNINSLISEMKLTSIDNFIRAIVILMAIGNILFIVVLFKLKKLISLFMINEFFTTDSIKLLKVIGNYLVLSTQLIYIPSLIYNFIYNYGSANGVFAQSLEKTSFLFFTLLGVFFTILSYIFEDAKKIKEENELTI